jgi:ABC-type Mn2+/Zn2+ transport system ATPase subunit
VLGEKSFFEIIRGLQNGHGLAIILVSHDIHLVYRYASRIVCINTTMLCQGPPHEIAENDDIIRIFGGYLTPYEHEHN